jgi:hypothetical protein
VLHAFVEGESPCCCLQFVELRSGSLDHRLRLL